MAQVTAFWGAAGRFGCRLRHLLLAGWSGRVLSGLSIVWFAPGSDVMIRRTVTGDSFSPGH